MDTKTTIDIKTKYKIGYDDEIKANEIGPNEIKTNDKKANVSMCKYDEVCSREKMCGDCAADEFESERNEEAWKNFKIDRKIALSEYSD
jgi:hypothetical protein